MDLSVVTGIFVWLFCWLMDILAVISPSLSMIFLIAKLIIIILGVIIVGKVLFGLHPLTLF